MDAFAAHTAFHEMNRPLLIGDFDILTLIEMGPRVAVAMDEVDTTGWDTWLDVAYAMDQLGFTYEQACEAAR